MLDLREGMYMWCECVFCTSLIAYYLPQLWLQARDPSNPLCSSPWQPCML